MRPTSWPGSSARPSRIPIGTSSRTKLGKSWRSSSTSGRSGTRPRSRSLEAQVKKLKDLVAKRQENRREIIGPSPRADRAANRRGWAGNPGRCMPLLGLPRRSTPDGYGRRQTVVPAGNLRPRTPVRSPGQIEGLTSRLIHALTRTVTSRDLIPSGGASPASKTPSIFPPPVRITGSRDRPPSGGLSRGVSNDS